MSLQKVLSKRLERRKKRIRGKIKGTGEKPRLTVFRSHGHIYAQIIDDVKGHTLASASTLDKEVRPTVEAGTNKTDKSKAVGKKLAERATANGISTVVFDRNGLVYHGRVKALADSAREAGLKF
ncbi:MAG: 50S ribosomal protein L18 [Candidatus Kapaibacteriales bacterium]